MLDFESDYEAWRKERFAAWPSNDELEFVAIKDPGQLGEEEHLRLKQQCNRTNFALYRVANPEQVTKDSIRSLVARLGMKRLDQNLCADNDSVTTLKVMETTRAQGYIPYTNKALNWHTDGYYNELDQHIRSFSLHCVQNALSGGESLFINHELIYIKLVDQDPRLAAALMQPDVLTIPPNVEDGIEVRGPQTGPVFYRDRQTNCLHMRYTARTRSVHWKDAPLVTQSKLAIENLLANSTELVLKYTLQPGEGFICNNILHGRSAFTNGNMSDGERVMYRVRSYDRLFTDSER